MTATLTTSEISTRPMPKLWAKLPIRTGNIIQLSGIAAGAALLVAAAHLARRRVAYGSACSSSDGSPSTCAATPSPTSRSAAPSVSASAPTAYAVPTIPRTTRPAYARS